MIDLLYDKILKIADGADMIVGTTHEVELLTTIYNLLLNKVLADLVTKSLREIGPPYTAEELDWARNLLESISREQKINALKRSQLPGWEELVVFLMETTTSDPGDEGQVMGGSMANATSAVIGIPV